MKSLVSWLQGTRPCVKRRKSWSGSKVLASPLLGVVCQWVFVHGDGSKPIWLPYLGEQTSSYLLYPIGSMYAIYGDIYHQYTPNVSIYTSTMDPMGTSYDPWGTIRLLMDFDSQPVFSLDVMTSNCCYKNGAWNTEYRSQFDIFWQQTQSNQNPVLHVPPTWQLDNDYSHTM